MANPFFPLEFCSIEKRLLRIPFPLLLFILFSFTDLSSNWSTALFLSLWLRDFSYPLTVSWIALNSHRQRSLPVNRPEDGRPIRFGQFSCTFLKTILSPNLNFTTTNYILYPDLPPLGLGLGRNLRMSQRPQSLRRDVTVLENQEPINNRTGKSNFTRIAYIAYQSQ